MATDLSLSKSAGLLLHQRLEGQRVEVTDETRDAYRELARAGLMVPLHTFAHGSESHYRITEEGWSYREKLLKAPAGALWPRR